MVCPMCPSHPTVSHGTGGTVLGTLVCPSLHGLSHVSIPSHCLTWDGRDCPRDSRVSQPTWPVPCVHPIPLSSVVLVNVSPPPWIVRLSNGELREKLLALGEHPGPIDDSTCAAYQVYLAKVQAAVQPRGNKLPCIPAYMVCPMCPSRPTVPHGTGGTVLGTPVCPSLHGLSHVSIPPHCPTWDWRDCPSDSCVSQPTWSVPCVRPVPLSHMGWRDCPRDSRVFQLTWCVPCVRPVPPSYMGLEE